MQTSDRINYIKSWILDYCKSMPKKPDSLVVGISGGIDSSVTSTICALTGKKTIVLSMPIKQIKEQQDLSLKHQEWLKDKFKNVESHLVILDNVFKSFKNSLSKFDNEHGFANSREVIRGDTDKLEKNPINFDKFYQENLIKWWKNKSSKRYESLKSSGSLRTELEVWTKDMHIDIIR